MASEAISRNRFDKAYREFRSPIKNFSRQKFQAIAGMDQDDLESEMLAVLWKACQAYDPNRGASFGTLFWNSANNRWKSLIRNAYAQKRQADVYTHTLADEAVQVAVDQLLQGDDPADIVVAMESVRLRRQRRI